MVLIDVGRAALLLRRVRGVGVMFGVANRLDYSVRLYGRTDKLEHDYVKYYRRHLGPSRLRKLRVYEIGVGGDEDRSPGGSLRIWRDYFPRSSIVGVDLYDKDVRLGRRVVFRKADQSVPAELLSIVQEVGAPDIVIDDGSHIGEHVHTTFRTLFPLMPAGAWYVIEDLSTSYSGKYGGGRPAPGSTAIGLLRTLISDVQSQDLTFVKHPDWTGPTPSPVHDQVGQVHVYPGIAFVQRQMLNGAGI